jgi:hypothetical protein
MSLNQVIFFGMADWGVMSVTNMDDRSWLDISSITYTTASGYVIMTTRLVEADSKRDS